MVVEFGIYDFGYGKMTQQTVVIVIADFNTQYSVILVMFGHQHAIQRTHFILMQHNLVMVVGLAYRHHTECHQEHPGRQPNEFIAIHFTGGKNKKNRKMKVEKTIVPIECDIFIKY